MYSALWFPPAGTFGIVLAVIGFIVSIIGFKGGRRVVLALVCVGLGVGEVVSIIRAEHAHASEQEQQHIDIESLRGELRRSETERQVSEAYLKAKLEDSYQVNAQLARFAPALMKLAKSTEEFTHRQFDAKIENDKDLYELTMQVVGKTREFSQKYAKEREQLFDELTAIQPNLTEAERERLWNENIQKDIALHYTREREFRSLILPDALYVRQELQRRKMAEPSLSPTKKHEVDLVFQAVLAGVQPELAMADYLEIMAKPLSRK